mmetsp:Transcript_26598/g.57019  ORF Transcript_26598/g.57019 Transcript_26598/m.57019 type:complete len:167 (+) Transcript_26598:166-666(+)
MKSVIAPLICIQLCVASTESYVVAPARLSAFERSTLSVTTSLSAYSSSPGGSSPNAHSSSAWGSRSSSASVPSKTVCESAVNVEWEPMSEMERRIEDGIHYEHVPNHYHQPQEPNKKRGRMPGCHPKAKRIVDEEEDGPSNGARAVFCAYRYSDEDYNRLKSADVS